MKLCIEKGLNFGPMIKFTTIIVSQFTRNSMLSSFWPKNYSNETPTLYPFFGSNDFWLFPHIKSALKG